MLPLDNQCFISGSRDKMMKIWKIKEFSLVKEY